MAANLGELDGPRDQIKQALFVEKTSGADLTCDMDNFGLDQVFRNHFENSLAACLDPVQVEVVCSDTEIYGQSAVRILIRDNGPGLIPEQTQNVFNPFYATKQKGTGLGMAIAKRIVDAHGGHIVVSSKPTSGAEFIVTLPRKGMGEG